MIRLMVVMLIDIYLRIDKADVIFLKLFTNFPYSQITTRQCYTQITTCVFFKLLLVLPIRKLAIKCGTFFISYAEYKIQKFLFIYDKSISSFVHLKSQKVLKMAIFKIKLPKSSCYHQRKSCAIREFLVVNHGIAF